MIDRIVLYVDDLDRCSPGKVLEVLEAVHLLLALELFIVVVGVDPRWLKRSLLHQYRDLSLSSDPSKDPYLQAMPIEYLEKIFQIPLSLPLMKPQGYCDLISSLTPATAPSDQPITSEVRPGPQQEPSSLGLGGGGPSSSITSEVRPGPQQEPSSLGSPREDQVLAQASFKAEDGSVVRGGEYIDLTSEEVTFIEQLSGLVATPRAAKRLINTYRLIRVTQEISPHSRFLGIDGKPGEYFAALTLLAISAGYPSLADQVLQALEVNVGKKGIKDWPSFVKQLEPNKGKLVPKSYKNPEPDDLLSQDAAKKWKTMYDGLTASIPDHPPDLEKYQIWGPWVARFSFTL